jgi:lipoprotein-anchoring transpeptidase ErfK/SrfK
VSGVVVPRVRAKPKAQAQPLSGVRRVGWRSHLAKPYLAVLAAVVVVILAGEGAFAAHFDSRILPGVTVAGQSVGNLTLVQAEQKLQAATSDRSVRLYVGSTTYHFTSAQVGVSYDVATTAQQAFLVGRHQIETPLDLLATRHAASIAYAYKQNMLTEKAAVQRVVADQGSPAVNAAIVITGGVPAIQSDKSGHAITAAAVENAINGQIDGSVSGPVALRPTVQLAGIRAANLSSAMQQTQKLLQVPITITSNGKTFQPTSAQKGAWVVYQPNPPNQAPGLTPSLSSAAIVAYLQTIAPQINVAAVPHRVNVLDGVASDIQAGQNGLQLDTSTLASKIISSVGSGQPLTLAAPTVPVAFTTQYNNATSLPYPKYVEVNLTTQHLWAYQDHQLVYDSPITSGATGAGFPTVTGTFSVLSKQTDRHLVGYQYGPAYNYDVFVQYWMQFYEGFGLHDASWRSSFGGPDYYYDGSHGCVNLPLATAAWLYNWVDIGTPVWVHN